MRDFLKKLDSRGELLRVEADADPVLEIAEITDRESKSPGGGRALYFSSTGTPFPVVTNLFGSERRMAAALGAESLDAIRERIEALLRDALKPRDTLAGKLAALPLLNKVQKWLPKRANGMGECQQVIALGDEASLDILPVLKCWPHDGGRFITLPLVVTADPDTGARNIGMYRMQILSPHTTAMHWHPHKTGARHYQACKRRGETMPVAVCLGGDPAYTYAATAPMPDGMDEWLLAGFLRNKPVRMVKCLTNELWVPADCDFVLEGYVDPAEEMVVEGPFGDHTGYYSLEDLFPVFHLTALTHRRDAVYPATVVGVPPMEDFYISQATEKIFLPPIRTALQPEISDMHMPAAGVAHNLALVSIRSSYPGQAFKVASGLWGAGQMMFNKALIVAPDGADIRDEEMVAALLRGVDPRRDVLLSHGVLDILDHATATPGQGGKIAVDATLPDWVASEGRPFPQIVPCGGITGVNTTLTAKWSLLILRAEVGVEVDFAEFFAKNPIEGLNFAALFDAATEGLTPEELLWVGGANCDPGRDMALHGRTLVLDCRTKLPGTPGAPLRWPNPVASDPATIARVDARREGFASSPSIRYSKLQITDSSETPR